MLTRCVEAAIINEADSLTMTQNLSTRNLQSMQVVVDADSALHLIPSGRGKNNQDISRILSVRYIK